MRTAEKEWTYEDYLKLNDDKRYEIIGGKLIVAPAPRPRHQRVSRNLEFAIWNYVRNKELGEVFYAPVDVVLGEKFVLQPDIVFVSKEREEIIDEDRAIFGPPDLVVEVVSPSTLGRDTLEKKDVYEKFGVKEFWLVYPEMKCVEVLVLNKEGKYEIYDEGCTGEGKREIKSKVIEGFEVKLEEIF